MLTTLAIAYLPESAVAIIVAVLGTATTLLVARWNAKRQVVRDTHDDSAVFRGEVLDDNKALRAEVRSLKLDLSGSEKLIAEKTKENADLLLLNFKLEQRIIMYEAQLQATRTQTANQLEERQQK